MTQPNALFRFVSASVLLSLSTVAFANDESQEQACQRQIDRFIGMQNHVKQLADNAVPAMAVGLSATEIEQITLQQGACAAWQQLVKSLQQQHSSVLDKTEQKTGKPSPKR